MVCDALERGQQTIILRKGGIHEGGAGFAFDHEEFFLFPTLFHEQEKHLRGSYSASAQNQENGEYRPGDPVAINCWAQLISVWNLDCWETIKELEPFHIWSRETIRDRFDWSKSPDSQPGIKMALVRIFRIGRPLKIEYQKSHGGCRSWLKLDGFAPGSPQAHNPAMDDRVFTSVLQKLTQIAGLPEHQSDPSASS